MLFKVQAGSTIGTLLFPQITNRHSSLIQSPLKGDSEWTKAGLQVITSNFSSQSINFMQRVNDLKHYKVFRRADVTLNKQAVINDWVSNGVTNNGVVQDLFTKYYNTLNPNNELTQSMTKIQLESFINNNSNWFDEIFNSNFN